ncbi:MAG: hypothetical protein ACLP0L_07410 [Solirubrobacteraceae bacterium]
MYSAHSEAIGAGSKMPLRQACRAGLLGVTSCPVLLLYADTGHGACVAALLGDR